MLGVRDIVNDLGVASVTVWSWIRHGKIKATMENRRVGWRIEENEYNAFLDQHPKWRMVHDGEIYKTSELKAREDALMNVLAKLIIEKNVLKLEDRDEKYTQGFNRAVNDITALIEKEMRKKGPEFIESRLEQVH